MDYGAAFTDGLMARKLNIDCFFFAYLTWSVMRNYYIYKEVTIMFKKWYAIKGITNELFDAWKNDLRSDILWWKEPEEETQLRIRLPLIEAIKMRILIRQFNKKNMLSLQLVRM